MSNTLPIVNQRINSIIKTQFNGNVKAFCLKIGYEKSQKVNRLFNIDARTNKYPQASLDIITDISNKLEINMDWLIYGKEPKFKADIQNKKPVEILSENKGEKKLIPLYDNVNTIGGRNDIIASIEGVSQPTEWIDAGDWFPDATDAVRHYGDSMTEYPSGCILVLKKVEDLRLILYGQNYCIETDEYRVTKRIQLGDTDFFYAYSSNQETYPDGRLIHEPFPIYIETIKRLFLVIGYVVNNYSSSAYPINKK